MYKSSGREKACRAAFAVMTKAWLANMAEDYRRNPEIGNAAMLLHFTPLQIIIIRAECG